MPDEEVQDFEIRSPAYEPEETELAVENDNAGGGAVFLVAGLLIAALAGGGYLFYALFLRGVPSPPPPPSPPPVVETEPPPPPSAPPEAEPEPIELPALDASDEAVRILMASLSSHPKVAAWLVPDDLVRRFVRVVANVAYDENPVSHVDFLRPSAGFRVVEEDGSVAADPRSYVRYNLLAEVFVSLDPEGSVGVYRQLRPLIEEAYAELGYPEPRFEVVLSRSLDKVLSVPLIEADVELKPRVISYEFADPDLEALSDTQKLFLRMGPENVRRIKLKLRALKRALDLA